MLSYLLDLLALFKELNKVSRYFLLQRVKNCQVHQCNRLNINEYIIMFVIILFFVGIQMKLFLFLTVLYFSISLFFND
ncbi:hypothetical protein Xmir_01230 [Xenorhabdus miraniensis]|uniref:Uncharacterized protein n=1 Tax=Xenorhabdus miraniensis TaxID=351674 RepID=A0A2D0JTV2_9GAMM|nr:hypothetical protein Xmir_01230 [Xenorhabdus miraniensis]